MDASFACVDGGGTGNSSRPRRQGARRVSQPAQPCCPLGVVAPADAFSDQLDLVESDGHAVPPLPQDPSFAMNDPLAEVDA